MLHKFLNYVNSTSSGTTYSNIAYYISNNFTKITQMNLEELAEACYVSQATISRFCRFLGFDSFTHFKMECQRSLRDGERRIYDIVSTMDSGDEEYKEHFKAYGKSIVDELEYLMDHMDLAEMDHLLDQIHNTQDVAFFGVHRCVSVIQELQFSFALKDKFVKAYAGSTQQVECARNLKKNSLAIVVTSNDGFWFEANDVVELLGKSPCRKILLASGHVGDQAEMFDEVIHVGSGMRRGCAYAMINYSEAMISRYFSSF